MAVRNDFIDSLIFTFTSFLSQFPQFCFSFMDQWEVVFLPWVDRWFCFNFPVTFKAAYQNCGCIHELIFWSPVMLVWYNDPEVFSELCIVNLLNVHLLRDIMQICVFSLNNGTTQNNITFFSFSFAFNWLFFVQLSPPCPAPPHSWCTELALQIIAVEKCCQGAHSLQKFCHSKHKMQPQARPQGSEQLWWTRPLVLNVAAHV